MQLLNSNIIKKPKRPVKIMQFGEGNFLRAFVDFFIHEMNEKKVLDSNVMVIQPVSFGRCKELKDQDGLYTLYLQGLNNGKVVKEHTVITCIDDLINPYTDYDKYLEFAKSEDLEFIISNTTEAGIVLDETDTSFETTPKSFPGKLLVFLEKRYTHFNKDPNKGLDIIPCELIDYNGDKLKEVLIELAKINKYDEDFINWIANCNRFYNTLVDRIVPGYPRNEAAQMQEDLGYLDNNLVVGEVFHLWVIQGPKGLEKKLRCQEAGLNVLFVDDIKPYKERKVKILNGSHTLLVPVSYLANIDTVRETIEDEQLGKYVKDFIFNEVVPTINIPKAEMDKFANEVLERYLNPFVRHELMSIALNSFTKFKTRILPTILENINDLNKLPKNSLFSLAALVYFYRGKRGNEDIKLVDDQIYLDFFKEIWSHYDGTYESVKEIAYKVLSYKEHWEVDLTTYEGVLDFVTDALYEICHKEMREALKIVGC